MHIVDDAEHCCYLYYSDSWHICFLSVAKADSNRIYPEV